MAAEKETGKKYVVEALDLVSFEEPTPSSAELGRYSAGAKVIVMAEKDGWAQLQGGAWVPLKQLKKA